MAKPRRIKDKLLHEAYTPVESDADGYSDGADFAAVVGNKNSIHFRSGGKSRVANPRMCMA